MEIITDFLILLIQKLMALTLFIVHCPKMCTRISREISKVVLVALTCPYIALHGAILVSTHVLLILALWARYQAIGSRRMSQCSSDLLLADEGAVRFASCDVGAQSCYGRGIGTRVMRKLRVRKLVRSWSALVLMNWDSMYVPLVPGLIVVDQLELENWPLHVRRRLCWCRNHTCRLLVKIWRRLLIKMLLMRIHIIKIRKWLI